MTSVVDTSVKFFHSEMPGAPVLNGTSGSLIAILDACLINGFGLKNVDSLVVSNNVATLTISTGHSAQVDTVIMIAGALPAGLNGEQKVTVITSTSISFTTSGVANQTATGSITVKLASAGWEKKFAGTNLAVYKSLAIESTACCLRLDDSFTKCTRVIAYESMSDINLGTGQFPLDNQISGGGYWAKSDAADATSRKWYFFGDGRLFYIYRKPNESIHYDYQAGVFGDFIPTKISGDPFACTLFVQYSDVSSGNATSDLCLGYASIGSTVGMYCPRSYIAMGASVVLGRGFAAIAGNTDGLFSGQVTSVAFPNATDGGLYTSPMRLIEPFTKVYRGDLTGYLAIPQLIPTGLFNMGERMINLPTLGNKTYMVVAGRSPWQTYSMSLIDITGPWRV
ncbi:MAG: hypothetical protein K2P84_00055 [Undibacterium sp.]|nr:hypothetical protein [Undibacterium sp.]